MRTIQADSRKAVSDLEKERDILKEKLVDKERADRAAINLQKTIVDREKHVENYLREIGELKETIRLLNTDKTGLRNDIDRKRKEQEAKEAILKVTHEDQLKEKEKEWEDRRKDLMDEVKKRALAMAEEYAGMQSRYVEDANQYNALMAEKEAELAQLHGQLNIAHERVKKAEKYLSTNFFPDIIQRNTVGEEKLRRAEEQLSQTTQRVRELQAQLDAIRIPNPNENPNPNRRPDLEREVEKLRSQLQKEKEIPQTLKKLHQTETEKFAKREKELLATLEKVRDRNYKLETQLEELQKPGISPQHAAAGVQLTGELKKGAEKEKELEIQKKKLEEEKRTMNENQKTEFKKAVDKSTESTQSSRTQIRSVNQEIEKEKKVEEMGVPRTVAQGLINLVANSITGLLGRQSDEMESTQGAYNKETQEFVQSSPSSPPESDQAHRFMGHGTVNPVPTSRAPIPAERTAMDALVSPEMMNVARDQPKEALRIVLDNIANGKLNIHAINTLRDEVRARKENNKLTRSDTEFLKILDPVLEQAVEALYPIHLTRTSSLPVVPLRNENENSPPQIRKKKEPESVPVTVPESESESESLPAPESETEEIPKPVTKKQKQSSASPIRRSTRPRTEPIKVKEHKETEKILAKQKEERAKRKEELAKKMAQQRKK